MGVFVFDLASMNSSFAQLPFSTAPQKEETRTGNKDYQKENFTEAETNYKKALDIQNNMPEAIFNLGDAVYQQKRYDSAQKQFQLSAKTNADPMVKAKAFHNLGNSYLEQKKWEDAVTAYKSSLKLNPKDADTKYNLAYANAMMQKNKGGGGQNNKDQNQKDQKDQQQKNQDQKNKNDQDKQQQQKDQQANKQDQKNQQEQAQKPKLTKEEADQLLAALENEEQKTNQKMQKKQVKAVRVKSKKDW